MVFEHMCILRISTFHTLMLGVSKGILFSRASSVMCQALVKKWLFGVLGRMK